MKARGHAVTCLSSITLVVAVSLAFAATLWADSVATTAPPPLSMAKVQSAYGHLPLSFEANHGQVDAPVKFLARGKGYTLFLTPTESVMVLQQREAPAEQNPRAKTDPTALPDTVPIKQAVVRMKLEGANPSPAIDGMDQLPGIVSYFIGNDPAKWRTRIPTYAKVQYHEAYPGIALAYYGNQGKLEYDFIVAPGADPNLIRLVFEGAEKVEVNPTTGDLVLTLSEPSANSELRTENSELAVGATLRLQKPVVYQMGDDGDKHVLAGTYVLLASETSLQRPVSAALHPSETPSHSPLTPHVAFQVASYDASKPLIIDPVLSWATYLGGSGIDFTDGLTIDAVGNVYVTGATESINFPTTPGVIQPAYAGGSHDAFVAKLNPTGTALIYATYLGGSGDDIATSISLDTAGNPYVVGYTDSTNFPTTPGVIQPSYIGGTGLDTFVVKLNPTGTALTYATYLGGNGNDVANSLAVDVAGNVYTAGETTSTNFPTTLGVVQPSFGGGSGEDAFVAKLNPTGTALIYATYLGGSGDDVAARLSIDATGNVYVAGVTSSTNFPTTPGVIQPAFAGGSHDAFVAKLNPTGTALIYATYLGGNGTDVAIGLTLNATGNVYVAGHTRSTNFPTTPGVIQPTFAGGDNDVFVAKLNPTGTTLVYATYLGGSGADVIAGNLAVDAVGNAYVPGQTMSTNFPTTPGAIQSVFGGGFGYDAFVAKLNPTGTALIYATYLGGSGDDTASDLAVDAAGNVYVGGETTSTNFPTTLGVVQPSLGGARDAFVAKISTTGLFAAFNPKVEITLGPLANDDQFEVNATLTLGTSSNGIAPLTEAVIIQVGTFSTTIPAGSFRQQKGKFKFEGVINGVQLEAVLEPLILGNDYEFKADATGAELTGTVNPVTVTLTIGNDSGSKTVTAEFH